jgi:hypothetical protein
MMHKSLKDAKRLIQAKDKKAKINEADDLKN